MPSSLNEEIDTAIAPDLERRRRMWAALVDRPTFREIYTKLLVHTYHYVKQSCPLMKRASSLICNGELKFLKDYFDAHVHEESGHELWVLQDLEKLGLPSKFATNTLPSGEVCSMVGAQIYLMEEYSPVSLLGYMYILEAYQPKKTMLDWLSQRHDIPRSAFYTLTEHSDLDVEHGRELKTIVNSVAFSQNEKDLILHSAALTVPATLSLLENVSRI